MLPGLTRVEEQKVPKGLVGFIAPWNYPLSMAITDIIPALMAGNACLLKPSRTTPLTALWAVDLMYEAGLPEDLITVVTGSGSQLGEPIIDEVDFLTFTGSTETGRTIAAQCGQRLTGYALELGGKNPVIVRADANLDKAVAGVIRGAFASAGQLCISFERCYVHEDVREEFTRRLVEEVEQLVLSTDMSYGPGMGSLHSRDQLAKVVEHVEDAVEAGATVLAGGRPRPDVGPLFYAPTVLADVTPDMDVAAEETFGPVLSLYGFGDDDEAVELANDSVYGLNASIWTRDVDRGLQMARRINAGTVNINEAYASTWGSIDAPMGGFKDSGLGRRHGREGIIKYTETKNIAVQRLLSPTDLPFLSQEQTAKVFDTALRLLHRNPFVTLRRP
jgi:succinate-semialdehyde dehydrogenase/glutarate-semialdehyde dehydrogenase